MISLAEQRKLQRERAMKVEAALRGGATPSIVAAEYGMSAAYVSRLARQCGVGPHGVNKARHAAISEAYAAGVPLKSICENFAIGRRTVWTALKATGTPLRRPTVRSAPRE